VREICVQNVGKCAGQFVELIAPQSENQVDIDVSGDRYL